MTETTKERSPFAERLKEAQASAGLTNDQLARELCISVRLVQRWRSGDTIPRYQNVRRISKVLDKTPDYFFRELNG